MPSMSPEVRDQWIANLRSGNFEQGRAFLKAIHYKGDTVKHCCLGVLAEQLQLLKKVSDLRWGVEGGDNGYANLSKIYFTEQNSVGLSEEDQARLIYMNDVEMAGFNKIADWIEQNL